MLDPQARVFLDRLAAFTGPNIEDLDAREARALSDPFLKSLGGSGAPVARVVDRTIPGPRGSLHVRIYTAAVGPPLGVLVYFHGGGYVYGSVETHDSACRLLTNEGACIVVSVDYGLAPEWKAPAPFEDAYAATEWVAANAASFGGDPARIAVGGDSAGGSLAAQVCLAARDRGTIPLVFQLLIYPGLDFDLTRESYRLYGDGYLLTVPKIEWFVRQYLARPEDADLPYVCPLRARRLDDLPPALVIVAEYDPIRDEGVEYARRLEAEGVPAALVQYDGQIHGFFSSLATFSQARVAVREAGRYLRLVFARRALSEGAAAVPVR